MIRLLVGLGNPGAEYDDTRHNAGFWWIDTVVRRLGATLQYERGYHGLVARVNRPLPGIEGPIWLLEPQTYMNLSGKSVAALARFYKIAPEEILVAHDELDLLPGQMKLKQGGSHAGHNGLRDMIAQLGSAAFWRLRLGIGHPGHKAEVVHYVLKKPSPTDRNAIDDCVTKSTDALDLLLAGEMERAMMKVHAKPPRPKPPKPARPREAGQPAAEAAPPSPPPTDTP